VQELEPARCAERIRRSRAAVALTGAGISTAAGVPDFRGEQGLYVTRRYDPEKVFEIGWFLREPRYFYEFSQDFVATVKDTRPTFSHRFLADLEREGRLAGVVTQNIDILHQLAGSRTVIELHGSYRSATCMGCNRRYEELTYSWWEEAMKNSFRSPVATCHSCQGVLKPDIVFFGEFVHGFEAAERLVAEGDLLLVIGSTLQVTPASFLPRGTAATTIIVNRGVGALPPAPHRFFVDDDIDAYLAAVAKRLGDDGEIGVQEPG
jgi:NAD-dependent deacetylase